MILQFQALKAPKNALELPQKSAANHCWNPYTFIMFQFIMLEVK